MAVDEDDTVCASCGAELVLICSACGGEVGSTDAVCPHCGESFDVTEYA
jgi:predicted amidophosphoribosyltransferase